MVDSDVLFSFRLRLLDVAREQRNVSVACRIFGIHRSTYYAGRQPSSARACRRWWRATRSPSIRSPIAAAAGRRRSICRWRDRRRKAAAACARPLIWRRRPCRRRFLHPPPPNLPKNSEDLPRTGHAAAGFSSYGSKFRTGHDGGGAGRMDGRSLRTAAAALLAVSLTLPIGAASASQEGRASWYEHTSRTASTKRRGSRMFGSRRERASSPPFSEKTRPPWSELPRPLRCRATPRSSAGVMSSAGYVRRITAVPPFR